MTDIHNLLHDNTPDEPSTEGWAEKVRGHRRRGRTLTGVAAGVLAVGLAIPVGVSLMNRPTQVTRPADAVSPAPARPTLPDRDAAEVCAETRELMTIAIAATTYAHPGEPVLKEGAVRAWLCGDDQADTTFGTRGPLDPLTADVDKAVSWFLNATPADSDQACTMEYRMTYTVAFEYADGSITPVQGELHGCRTTTDGSKYANGGEEFLDLLTDLWTANRAADLSADATLCSTQASILPAKPENAVSAAVCFIGNSGTLGTAQLGDVAPLAASIGANTVVSDGMNLDFGVETIMLDLADKAGDMIQLQRLADGSYVFYADSQAKVWTPTADESALLDAAIASAKG